MMMSVVSRLKSVRVVRTARIINIVLRFSRPGSNKINGQMNTRGRPRIPTPDVQKDGAVDKDNKQNMSANGSVQPGTYPSDAPAIQVICVFLNKSVN